MIPIDRTRSLISRNRSCTLAGVLTTLAVAGALLPAAGAQTVPATPPTPAAPPTPANPTQAAPTPPAPAPAAAPAAPPPWYQRVQVSGSIDTYYDYNTNSPNVLGAPATAGGAPTSLGSLNQLQNWTFHANQFSLPLAELVLQETPDPAKSPLGFKLVLGYGDATDWIHGGFPSEGVYKNLKEAYATYIANGKTSAPITVNLGKFVTWNGYEVIESQGNPNYSHGLLFAWAIPYYHMGISASRPFGPKLTLTGYLVNGVNNVVDNNNGKTFGYTVSWTPSSKFTLVHQGTIGPEGTGDEHDYRILTDNILTYTPNAKWQYVLNYDYAHDKPAGASVKWQGVAGYVHYTVNSKAAATLRAELLNDANGFAISAPGSAPIALAQGTVLASPTTPGQEVKEGTLTYEYRFHPRVITRFEVREDWSTKNVFAKGTTPIPPVGSPSGIGNSKTQTQFIIGNIFTF